MASGHVPETSGMKLTFQHSTEASGSIPYAVTVCGARTHDAVEQFQLGAQTGSVPTSTGGGRPAVSHD